MPYAIEALVSIFKDIHRPPALILIDSPSSPFWRGSCISWPTGMSSVEPSNTHQVKKILRRERCCSDSAVPATELTRPL